MFTGLQFLSYIGAVAIFVFAVVCLAAGLFYLSELMEEYTSFTKKVLKHAILAAIAVHVLIWVWDGLPTMYILVGIASHAIYLPLLKDFPFIDLSNPYFLAGIGLLVMNHVVWFRHFGRVYYPFGQILGFFFLLVWCVPFGFFISLAANENVLPGAGSGAPTMLAGNDGTGVDASYGEDMGGLGTMPKRARVSLVRKLFRNAKTWGESLMPSKMKHHY